MISKQELRHQTKAHVKELSASQKRDKSALIFSQISQTEAFREAHTVALYASLPDEPQTSDFIAQIASQKRVVLPRIAGEDMDFYPYHALEMQVGAFGINEPQGRVVVSAEQIDLIICPGVAFTVDGHRLGRGKGFYDRYMSRKGFRAVKIGVCYKEQLVERIPDEPHDILMDIVISE